MGVLIDNKIDGKEKVKSTVLEFLEKNEIPYSFGLQQRQNPRFYRGNKNALVKIKRGEQRQATKT